jgi:ankyrin repeat protein
MKSLHISPLQQKEPPMHNKLFTVFLILHGCAFITMPLFSMQAPIENLDTEFPHIPTDLVQIIAGYTPTEELASLSQQYAQDSQLHAQLVQYLHERYAKGLELIQATEQANELLMIKLLNEEAYIDAQNELGNTALIASLDQLEDENLPDKETIVALLMKYGASLDIQNNCGETACMKAIDRCHFSSLRLLICTGANPNIKDNNGHTALMRVIFEQKTCNQTDLSRMQYLISNLNSYKLSIIKILLGAPMIDLNIQDNDGMTALMYAAQYGNREVVELLLQVGAFSSIKNNQGQTAYDIADDSCKSCFRRCTCLLS